MQVILLEHIRKLGKLGDLVNVKSGFARNYLIPFGKAEIATKQNLERFEERRHDLEKKANAILTEATQKAEVLNDKEITVQAMASDEGKLYGSIGAREIVAAVIEQTQVNISKKDIMLPDGPIHTVGDCTIAIQLEGDVTADINLIVERQSEKH